MMIWTGTNEIMNLVIQHEYYKLDFGNNLNKQKVYAPA
jgi:hypothetical protein